MKGGGPSRSTPASDLRLSLSTLTFAIRASNGTEWKVSSYLYSGDLTQLSSRAAYSNFRSRDFIYYALACSNGSSGGGGGGDGDGDDSNNNGGNNNTASKVVIIATASRLSFRIFASVYGTQNSAITAVVNSNGSNDFFFIFFPFLLYFTFFLSNACPTTFIETV